jgi:hypothetical protein
MLTLLAIQTGNLGERALLGIVGGEVMAGILWLLSRKSPSAKTNTTLPVEPSAAGGQTRDIVCSMSPEEAGKIVDRLSNVLATQSDSSVGGFFIPLSLIGVQHRFEIVNALWIWLATSYIGISQETIPHFA